MALKIDFSDIKNNQKVFHPTRGIIQIELGIADNSSRPFTDNDGTEYLEDGKEYEDDLHPNFFHSIEECIEYFQSVKKDMDEESKPKKRYWIFSIKSGKTWTKDLVYLDETGRDTAGMVAFDNWFDREKIKHENEFIDV